MERRALLEALVHQVLQEVKVLQESTVHLALLEIQVQQARLVRQGAQVMWEHQDL